MHFYKTKIFIRTHCCGVLTNPSTRKLSLEVALTTLAQKLDKQRKLSGCNMRPVFISGIFSGNFRRQKYFLGDRTCNLQRYLL